MIDNETCLPFRSEDFLTTRLSSLTISKTYDPSLAGYLLSKYNTTFTGVFTCFLNDHFIQKAPLWPHDIVLQRLLNVLVLRL